MTFLKKNLIFFVLFSIVFLIVYLYKRYQKAPKISFYNEQFFDSNQNLINLNNFKGKPFIVTFYASWCGDCIKELKELNSIKDSELASIPVLFITDESFEKLTSFEQKKKYPFIFCKTKKSFNELSIHAIPVTYLLNSNGEVVYEHIGILNWRDKSFLQYAKNLLR
jgi:thiol-disulfide isomerase/thioredoxin